MKRRLLISSILLSACSNERLLSPPALPTAESALILSPSRPAFAASVSFGPSASARLELPDRTDSYPVLLTLYECTLESLGLPSGPVPLREGAGRSFPGGAASYRLDPEEDDGWQSVDPARLQAEMGALRLDQPEAPACNDFPVVLGPIQHSFPARSNPVAMVSFQNEWALIATTKALYWVRPDLSIERALAPELGEDALTLLASGPDESLIVQKAGPVLMGHPDRGFRTHGPVPPNADELMSVAQSPVGAAASELFVLSGRGLARFDGGAWSVLDQTSLGVELAARPGAVWIRPGEAVFLPPDPERRPRVLHLRDGTLREILVPDVPRNLTLAANIGLVSGTERGQVLRIDLSQGTVESIDEWSGPLRPLWVSLMLEDSVLFGGWSGLMNQYFLDGRFCDATGFTPPVLGANLSTAALLGPEAHVLGAGLAGFGETSNRLVLFRLGRSSALPDRCPSP